MWIYLLLKYHTMLVVLKVNHLLSFVGVIFTISDLVHLPATSFSTIPLAITLTSSLRLIISTSRCCHAAMPWWVSSFFMVALRLPAVTFLIPSFSRPLFRPSRRMQAFHSTWLEIYPQWEHVPWIGILTSLLTARVSPEWMMSMIALGWINSKSFRNALAYPR